MPRARGLRVITRTDRAGALTIVGTVAGQRIRRRAQSNSPKLAREEAAAIETELLRTAWHGERRGARAGLIWLGPNGQFYRGRVAPTRAPLF